MSTIIKKIYIFTTQTLRDHVIVDVSELSQIQYQSQIKKKFNLDELNFVYSADFIHRMFMADGEEIGLLPANTIKDSPHHLNHFFDRSKSNFGDEIYKANLLEIVNLIADEYSENYEVSNEYRSLIEEKERMSKTTQMQWNKAVNAEHDFLTEYQSQYDEINATWSKFWDQKIDIFRNYILKNEFPVEKTSIFFKDRNHKNFNEQSARYVKTLCLETEKWRLESKSLQSYLNAKCRHCNTLNKVYFRFIGPGNKHTFGGNNQNTYLEREYLLKPEYGKKLKSGKKYYWRLISGLEGNCSNCNQSILTNSFNGEKILGNLVKLKNIDTCAIYPYDDKGSWYEWCGVWMTIFEWYCYDIKNQTNITGYDFFASYRTIHH